MDCARAAALVPDYSKAFDYFDNAYSELSREFSDTVDWKMRAVLIGNALGYAASMAYSGKPPTPDYAVPVRGSLLSFNLRAAEWYDENRFSDFDLAPTLLVMYANTVGKTDRALYWATIGIETARKKGVITSIHTLAEMLIPNSIESRDLNVASDCAYEAATALSTTPPSSRLW